MTNIFSTEGAKAFIDRIEKLNPESTPIWGKMTVAQMLAHVNVAYEMTFENIHPKPGAFKRLILKLFVKGIVVGDKPVKKNSPTAPEFRIQETKDFAKEKDRLIGYIKKCQELGEDHFDGRESHSFGTLTKGEWNMMFAKHLDHHLSQFGV